MKVVSCSPAAPLRGGGGGEVRKRQFPLSIDTYRAGCDGSLDFTYSQPVFLSRTYCVLNSGMTLDCPFLLTAWNIGKP